MQLVIGMLAVCGLALGVLHLLRLSTQRSDRIGEAAHAAMGFGMAAMFSPVGDPVPAPLWIAVFACMLAWFGTLVLRSGTLAGEPGHHVVGSAAMLFMLLGAPTDPMVMDGAAAAGHAAHGGGAAGSFSITSIVAIVLAGYFAWHVLRCTDHLRVGVTAEPAVAGDAVAVRARVLVLPAIGRPQTAAVAHIVMAVGMVVMLLGMV